MMMRYSPEELELLRHAITISYRESGLPGLEICHGTQARQIPSILEGPKDLGSGGLGGSGLNVVTLDDGHIARQYAQFRCKDDKGVVVEGRLNPDKKDLRVARIRLGKKIDFNLPDASKGILPIHWAKDPELRKFIKDNFDIVEILDAKISKNASAGNRFLVISESAGNDAIIWKGSRGILASYSVKRNAVGDLLPREITPSSLNRIPFLSIDEYFRTAEELCMRNQAPHRAFGYKALGMKPSIVAIVDAEDIERMALYRKYLSNVRANQPAYHSKITLPVSPGPLTPFGSPVGVPFYKVTMSESMTNKVFQGLVKTLRTGLNITLKAAPFAALPFAIATRYQEKPDPMAAVVSGAMNFTVYYGACAQFGPASLAVLPIMFACKGTDLTEAYFFDPTKYATMEQLTMEQLMDRLEAAGTQKVIKTVFGPVIEYLVEPAMNAIDDATSRFGGMVSNAINNYIRFSSSIEVSFINSLMDNKGSNDASNQSSSSLASLPKQVTPIAMPKLKIYVPPRATLAATCGSLDSDPLLPDDHKPQPASQPISSACLPPENVEQNKYFESVQASQTLGAATIDSIKQKLQQSRNEDGSSSLLPPQFVLVATAISKAILEIAAANRDSIEFKQANERLIMNGELLWRDIKFRLDASKFKSHYDSLNNVYQDVANLIHQGALAFVSDQDKQFNLLKGQIDFARKQMAAGKKFVEHWENKIESLLEKQRHLLKKLEKLGYGVGFSYGSAGFNMASLIANPEVFSCMSAAAGPVLSAIAISMQIFQMVNQQKMQRKANRLNKRMSNNQAELGEAEMLFRQAQDLISADQSRLTNSTNLLIMMRDCSNPKDNINELKKELEAAEKTQGENLANQQDLIKERNKIIGDYVDEEVDKYNEKWRSKKKDHKLSRTCTCSNCAAHIQHLEKRAIASGSTKQVDQQITVFNQVIKDDTDIVNRIQDALKEASLYENQNQQWYDYRQKLEEGLTEEQKNAIKLKRHAFGIHDLNRTRVAEETYALDCLLRSAHSITSALKMFGYQAPAKVSEALILSLEVYTTISTMDLSIRNLIDDIKKYDFLRAIEQYGGWENLAVQLASPTLFALSGVLKILAMAFGFEERNVVLEALKTTTKNLHEYLEFRFKHVEDKLDNLDAKLNIITRVVRSNGDELAYIRKEISTLNEILKSIESGAPQENSAAKIKKKTAENREKCKVVVENVNTKILAMLKKAINDRPPDKWIQILAVYSDESKLAKYTGACIDSLDPTHAPLFEFAPHLLGYIASELNYGRILPNIQLTYSIMHATKLALREIWNKAKHTTSPEVQTQFKNVYTMKNYKQIQAAGNELLTFFAELRENKNNWLQLQIAKIRTNSQKIVELAKTQSAVESDRSNGSESSLESFARKRCKTALDNFDVKLKNTDNNFIGFANKLLAKLLFEEIRLNVNHPGPSTFEMTARVLSKIPAALFFILPPFRLIPEAIAQIPDAIQNNLDFSKVYYRSLLDNLLDNCFEKIAKHCLRSVIYYDLNDKSLKFMIKLADSLAETNRKKVDPLLGRFGGPVTSNKPNIFRMMPVTPWSDEFLHGSLNRQEPSSRLVLKRLPMESVANEPLKLDEFPSPILVNVSLCGEGDSTILIGGVRLSSLAIKRIKNTISPLPETINQLRVTNEKSFAEKRKRTDEYINWYDGSVKTYHKEFEQTMVRILQKDEVENIKFTFNDNTFEDGVIIFPKNNPGNYDPYVVPKSFVAMFEDDIQVKFFQLNAKLNFGEMFYEYSLLKIDSDEYGLFLQPCFESKFKTGKTHGQARLLTTIDRATVESFRKFIAHTKQSIVSESTDPKQETKTQNLCTYGDINVPELLLRVIYGTPKSNEAVGLPGFHSLSIADNNVFFTAELAFSGLCKILPHLPADELFCFNYHDYDQEMIAAIDELISNNVISQTLSRFLRNRDVNQHSFSPDPGFVSWCMDSIDQIKRYGSKLLKEDDHWIIFNELYKDYEILLATLSLLFDSGYSALAKLVHDYLGIVHPYALKNLAKIDFNSYIQQLENQSHFPDIKLQDLLSKLSTQFMTDFTNKLKELNDWIEIIERHFEGNPKVVDDTASVAKEPFAKLDVARRSTDTREKLFDKIHADYSKYRDVLKPSNLATHSLFSQASRAQASATPSPDQAKDHQQRKSTDKGKTKMRDQAGGSNDASSSSRFKP